MNRRSWSWITWLSLKMEQVVCFSTTKIKQCMQAASSSSWIVILSCPLTSSSLQERGKSASGVSSNDLRIYWIFQRLGSSSSTLGVPKTHQRSDSWRSWHSTAPYHWAQETAASMTEGQLDSIESLQSSKNIAYCVLSIAAEEWSSAYWIVSSLAVFEVSADVSSRF
jgi:hypothetical protein